MSYLCLITISNCKNQIDMLVKFNVFQGITFNVR